MIQNSISDNRIVWLDVIRCVAMIMVIGVHCIDPFYISPTMRAIPEYTHWAAIYGSLLRPSVPLFVMMTGLLLLPVKKHHWVNSTKSAFTVFCSLFLYGRCCIACFLGLQAYSDYRKRSSVTSFAIHKGRNHKA